MSQPAPLPDPEPMAALAAAVHPRWQDAVLKLAEASQTLSDKLSVITGPAVESGLLPKTARDLVTQLIDFLDSLDADPDLEPTLGSEPVPGSDECERPEDDEPSLGSLDRMMDQNKAWAVRNWHPVTGADFAIDSEKDDSDNEPSLGSVENFGAGSQELWASGDHRDLESEHDGSEPSEDEEPSLGSFDAMVSQLSSWKQRAGWFPGSDREQDDCDAEDDDPAANSDQPVV